MFSKIIKKVLFLHLIFTLIIIKTQNMNNVSLKNGLIGAGISIIISLIIWLINPSLYLKIGSWLGLLVGLFFIYRTAKESRDLNGGFIEFGELFKNTFIMVVIMTLLSSLFAYILYNFIDPNLVELQKQVVTESIEKMGSMMGEEKMNEVMDKMQDQDFSFTIGKLLQGWVVGLLLWAIPCVIFSAIMKKKDPAFNEFA